MAVLNIQNIINYDPEELEAKYMLAKENYKKDPRVIELNRKEKFFYTLAVGYNLCMFFLVIALAFTLAFNEQLEQFILSNFKLFVCLSLLTSLPCFFLFSYHLKVYRKSDLMKDAIYESYFPSDLYFYSQIKKQNILGCYGKVVDDSKIEITIIIETEDNEIITNDDFIFDYDGSNPDGILTLDVVNDRVFFS